MGFWKFYSNLSSFTDLLEALIIQIDINYKFSLLLGSAVASTIENLISIILQGTATVTLWYSNINNIVGDNVAWSGIFCESAIGIDS